MLLKEEQAIGGLEQRFCPGVGGGEKGRPKEQKILTFSQVNWLYWEQNKEEFKPKDALRNNRDFGVSNYKEAGSSLNARAKS